MQVLSEVSSIGLNEQELAFISKSIGGPHGDLHQTQGQPPLMKIKDILGYLLNKHGHTSNNPSSKFTRVHFHSLTYHVIATIKGTWANSQAAVIAGTRVSALQACDTNRFSEERFALKIPHKLHLSESIAVKFDPRKPGISWEEGEVEFYYSPVLVCRKPLKTVGLGDAISATGLLYSSFNS